MEPEQVSSEVEQEDKFANLKKVTPLSKYLAMALFVALPFLGGWIGYKYSSPKIVELEKIVEVEREVKIVKKVEVGNQSKSDGVASLVTISTLPDDGNYASERYYTFDNGLYSVSFVYSRTTLVRDDYSSPNNWTKSYQVSFPIVIEGKTTRPFVYRVISKGYCYLEWCIKKPVNIVSILDQEWESLGGYEYCDVGACGGTDYLYRRDRGDFVEYISTDLDFSEVVVENGQNYASRFMSTLSLEIY